MLKSAPLPGLLSILEAFGSPLPPSAGESCGGTLLRGHPFVALAVAADATIAAVQAGVVLVAGHGMTPKPSS